MKTLTMTMLVVLAAGSAVAGINTDKPVGPLNIYWNSTGETWIQNDGFEPFTFDGYSAASAGGLIDSAAWNPIPESVSEGLVDPATIGMDMMDAFTWAEMSRTADLISEAHLSAAATLQPGANIPLGPAFPGIPIDDITFTYVNSATQESYEGRLIPEPASLTLLALGGIALIRRRR